MILHRFGIRTRRVSQQGAGIILRQTEGAFSAIDIISQAESARSYLFKNQPKFLLPLLPALECSIQKIPPCGVILLPGAGFDSPVSFGIFGRSGHGVDLAPSPAPGGIIGAALLFGLFI